MQNVVSYLFIYLFFCERFVYFGVKHDLDMLSSDFLRLHAQRTEKNVSQTPQETSKNDIRRNMQVLQSEHSDMVMTYTRLRSIISLTSSTVTASLCVSVSYRRRFSSVRFQKDYMKKGIRR